MEELQLSDEKEAFLSTQASLGIESCYFSTTDLSSVDYVQSKIEEFSNLFNGSFRLSLLNCTTEQRESLIYLLTSLRKSISYTIQGLGKSLTKRTYTFRCAECNENIHVMPKENIWSALQNHEHFEQLYYKFLNGELEIISVEEESAIPTTSESESTNILKDTTTPSDSNTEDSGIDQQEMEPSSSDPKKSWQKKDLEDPSDVNSFRFNFNLAYDEEIERKIYPPPFMQAVRRYDKVREFTIQRAGNSKAVCLICLCEMSGMRVSKHMMVNHTMGQRHLKAATNPQLLEMLRFYHEFWVKQDPPIQAHQVYFRLDTIPHLKCALCYASVRSDQILWHIMLDEHRKRVLEMWEKGNGVYYLVDMQAMAYGVTQEQIDAKETEFRKRDEVQFREKKQRKESDSDTPDEARKLAANPNATKHNIIKSVESIDSSNPLECVPNRMKEDVKFLKRSPKSDGSFEVYCTLCKCSLRDSLALIKSHVVMAAPHQALRKEKYSFYCEICNTRAMNEIGWQNHNFSGPRHVNMAASRKDKVTEYECTACKTVIFGDELSLNRHLSIGNRGNKKDKAARLPDPVKILLQTKDHICAEAAQLAGDAEEVLNNSLTNDCCARIKNALLEQFDQCEVYPFGSRISGIGNKGSDLDVFVDTGNMYYGYENQDPPEQVVIIRKANKAFAKNREYTNINQVLTARTPILKLHHLPTKLDSDLSFKHGLSVENTKFLRFCIELQPVIQQLILLVKKWAEHIIFENITTYALATLCIFFLQVNGYLLSVEKLRKINKAEPKIICGWKTITYTLTLKETKDYIKSYPKTVADLLKEFFEFYSKFDFNSYVVCPLLGRVVKRNLFDEPQDLPPEMEDYVAQLESEDRELFRSNSFMCIQDPFDLSHNLTKAAQKGTVTKFQTMCKLTLTHLDSLK